MRTNNDPKVTANFIIASTVCEDAWSSCVPTEAQKTQKTTMTAVFVTCNSANMLAAAQWWSRLQMFKDRNIVYMIINNYIIGIKMEICINNIPTHMINVACRLRVGPHTEPCSTPLVMFRQLDKKSNLSLWFDKQKSLDACFFKWSDSILTIFIQCIFSVIHRAIHCICYFNNAYLILFSVLLYLFENILVSKTFINCYSQAL